MSDSTTSAGDVRFEGLDDNLVLTLADAAKLLPGRKPVCGHQLRTRRRQAASKLLPGIRPDHIGRAWAALWVLHER